MTKKKEIKIIDRSEISNEDFKKLLKRAGGISHPIKDEKGNLILRIKKIKNW